MKKIIYKLFFLLLYLIFEFSCLEFGIEMLKLSHRFRSYEDMDRNIRILCMFITYILAMSSFLITIAFPIFLHRLCKAE